MYDQSQSYIISTFLAHLGQPITIVPGGPRKPVTDSSTGDKNLYPQLLHFKYLIKANTSYQ